MNFSFLPQFWSYFNYGVLVTIMISVCVVFFGTILGVLVSLAKRSGIKPLEWLVSLYVWVFRGTPMVVQIMIAFNLIHMNLPTVQFGILNLDLSRIVPGIIVLSLNSGAYISESVRAGIESIPKGQIEAAYSLGIRPWNTMRYVVLPQAIKNILPATERSLSLVYVILNVLSICQNILSHIRSEVFYAVFSSLFCFSSSNSRRTSSPYLSIIRTRKSIHGSLTVKYKKKCSQALWYLLFLRQLFCFVL